MANFKPIQVAVFAMAACMAAVWWWTILVAREAFQTSALIAFSICLMASVSGNIFGVFVRSPALQTAQLFVVMGIRSGIPFMACMWVTQKSESLNEHGFIEFTLLFYFVGLFSEIVALAFMSSRSNSATLDQSENEKDEN